MSRIGLQPARRSLPHPDMLYPIQFRPIFKERIWGGRRLEKLYGKALPPGILIGESWEIADRPGDSSVIANGPWAGRDLRWLLDLHSDRILGKASAAAGRFPLLVKLIDARQALSLQVHPPASVAARLGGEAKTEFWFFTEADPGAEIFLGLRAGVGRDQFERQLEDGTVAGCFHREPVRAGDAAFLPSGRVHALGAGLVLIEIQQNSDTTYRVFDWNRVGQDGRPRELHIEAALASIDFSDHAPGLVQPVSIPGPASVEAACLARNPHFAIDRVAARADARFQFVVPDSRPLVVVGIRGALELAAGGESVTVTAGQVCLLPAAIEDVAAYAAADTCYLQAQPG